MRFGIVMTVDGTLLLRHAPDPLLLPAASLLILPPLYARRDSVTSFLIEAQAYSFCAEVLSTGITR